MHKQLAISHFLVWIVGIIPHLVSSAAVHSSPTPPGAMCDSTTNATYDDIDASAIDVGDDLGIVLSPLPTPYLQLNYVNWFLARVELQANNVIGFRTAPVVLVNGVLEDGNQGIIRAPDNKDYTFNFHGITARCALRTGQSIVTAGTLLGYPSCTITAVGRYRNGTETLPQSCVYSQPSGGGSNSITCAFSFRNLQSLSFSASNVMQSVAGLTAVDVQADGVVVGDNLVYEICDD